MSNTLAMPQIGDRRIEGLLDIPVECIGFDGNLIVYKAVGVQRGMTGSCTAEIWQGRARG